MKKSQVKSSQGTPSVCISGDSKWKTFGRRFGPRWHSWKLHRKKLHASPCNPCHRPDTWAQDTHRLPVHFHRRKDVHVSRSRSFAGKTGGPPTPKPTPPLEGHWESRLILARGHAHVRSIKGAMPLSARQKATAAAAYVTSRLSTCGGETASAIVAAPRHSAAASRNVESSKVSS